MRLSKLRNLNPSAIGHDAPWQLENTEIEAFCYHHCAMANSGKTSFCNLQMHRAFIADFPTEKFGYHSSYTPTDGGLVYLIIAVEEIS